MKYSIVFSSATGNTAQLAEALRAALPPQDCVYYGAPAPEVPAAPLVLAGFWTNKGDCDAALGAWLETLQPRNEGGQQVFLFGTAGFGGDPAYFAGILQRVQGHLPAGCRVVGSYMCQGKMPASVRSRYAALLPQDPAKFQPLLDNFDRAATHPDADDLAGVVKAVRACLG